LRLLAAGHSPKQIARTLGKAERTVRHQMESARRHLGAATMLAAMVMAADAGLLHPDKPA
jgi:DNA-binding NarL/FixJ family response regulator